MDVSEILPLVSGLFDVGRERYRQNTNWCAICQKKKTSLVIKH